MAENGFRERIEVMLFSDPDDCGRTLHVTTTALFIFRFTFSEDYGVPNREKVVNMPVTD